MLLTVSKDLCNTEYVKKVLLLSLLLLFSAVTVHAEESSSQSGKRIYKDSIKPTIVQKREEIKDLRQKALDDMKLKISQMKDEKKKMTVQKLGDRLCMLQSNRVTDMKKQMAVIEKVMGRVTDASVEQKAKGKDVTAIESALTTAREKYKTAQQAITALSTRTCAVSLSGNEATVGAEMKKAVSDLEVEVKKTRESIKAVRSAVEDAVRALAKTRGEGVPGKLRD